MDATAFLQRDTYKLVDVLLSLQQLPGMEKAHFCFLLLFVLLESLSFILQKDVITIRQQAILGLGMEGIHIISWKLLFTGVIETLINRGRKCAKESLTTSV